MSIVGAPIDGLDASILTGEWPFVERDAELGWLQRQLRSQNRGGALIVGESGIGKSRLAREFAAAAPNAAVVRITGAPGLKEVPFGALSEVLPGPAMAETRIRGESLGRVAHALAATAGRRRLVVVVDDVHLIDDLSVVVLTRLVESMQAFLVATTRVDSVASPSVLSLWKNGILERLDLKALTPLATDVLVSHVLRGHVDGQALQWLHACTEGNPLYLRELLRGLIDEGAAVCEDGLWGITERPIPRRLVELIDDRLSVLPDEHKRAVEILAYGDPLGLSVFQLLVGAQVAEELEASGIATINQELDGFIVRFAHPLFREVTRAKAPRLRGRAIEQSLVDAVESLALTSTRPEDLMRVAVWRMEGGGKVRPATMLSAAYTAWDRYAFPLAEQLARAAVGAGAGFEAKLLLAVICWSLGRGDEAESILTGLAGEDCTEMELAQLTAIRMNVMTFGASMSVLAAIELAREVERGLTSQTALDLVAATRALIQVAAGDTRAGWATVSEILPRAGADTVPIACLAGSTACALAGRVGDALALADRGVEGSDRAATLSHSMGQHTFTNVRSLALVHAGSLQAADTLVRTAYQTAIRTGHPFAHGHLALEIGRIMLARGHASECIRYAREAAVLFRGTRKPLFLQWALTQLVHAAALIGDDAAADAVVAEIAELDLPREYELDAELSQALAVREAATGRLDAARALLAAGIASAQRSGDRVLEAACLHDMARFGVAGAEVASELELVVADLEGPLPAARLRHVQALARDDGAELEAVAIVFEDLGANLFAAEAASAAALLHRRDSSVRASVAAERRAQRNLDLCGPVHSPGVASVSVQAVLTKRELQTVRLAARGMSNTEIAQTLTLSVRTVANHLQRAYEKLGVSSRRALGEVLAAASPGRRDGGI
jgi:DNA-binding NarL/FixJ family response regulator